MGDMAAWASDEYRIPANSEPSLDDLEDEA